ncbi:MAG: Gfo/Idh/MocA family oxidoreductase [Pedosphaera sp.]|nr:Gfo/Idh/MocA family oxidoreductase [Pedosphaera sp.]
MRRVKGARLVAAADPHAPLRTRAKRELDCTPYADARALLERERPDAVLIFSDNAAHVPLTEFAAAHGAHVFVEKPLAADLRGAERMLAAVKRAKVRLMVNWPVAWWPQLQHAVALAKSGEIGDVWQVKYRAAHAGPREMGCSRHFSEWLYDARRNGGGAFIDYCCYGAMLARAMLGRPTRVTGVAERLLKRDLRTEDNGLLAMHYPHALALAEASWTQIGHLTSYFTFIYGTTGTLLVEPGDTGRLLRATAKEPDGKAVKVPRPAAHLRSASAHFIHGLKTGAPFHLLCDPTIGRDTQEILEAGIRSARKRASVTLKK